MAPLSQSFSFSSQLGSSSFSSSQLDQNSTSDPLKSLRPVTIRQLLKAVETDDPSAPFKIDGHPFRKVVLVAHVHDKTSLPSSSTTTYGLDDGTGRLKGNRWTKHEHAEPNFDFAYARVIGELQSYKGWRSIKITHIRPICDPHQIYHHILSAIYTTVALEKGLPPPDLVRELSQAAALDEMDDLSEELQRSSLSHNDDRSATLAAGPTPSQADRYSNLSTVERVFLQCLANQELESDESDDVEGVHVDDFCPEVISLIPGLTSEELCAAIDNLIAHNFIATFDDEHFIRL